MVDVVGLGQCCIDYLGLIDDYPRENDKKEFTGLTIQGGGPAATALVCLARLGRKTAFVGRVGDDPFGHSIVQGFEEEGISTEHLEIGAGQTSQFSYIAVNPARASRTIFTTLASEGEIQPESLPLGLLSQARVLHLDGLYYKASLAAAIKARQAGRLVVLDAGTLRPHSLDLITQVDHLVVGEPFALAFAPSLPPEEAVVRLYELGVSAAVITLGELGSVGFDGREVIHQQAFEVSVKDTTGAGDSYHGGYIDALLDGLDLKDRMERASALAALCTTALGGRTALPDRPGLQKFMAGAVFKA